ncbi:AMP-dependent synthetase/ligase [Thalassovita taeanensis]|nr:AMP-binding protein [Thalassovita taeanensis]
MAGETTLPKMLRQNAAEHGSKLALREKKFGLWQGADWNHYYQTARRVAFGLWALGLTKEDTIAIASENTPEWLYADLGAQMIGVRVTGIYPTNPWPELQYIVKHCKAKVAITGDQEQTDKVLDALKFEGGMPDLLKCYCVDNKGMREYTEDHLGSFDDLLALGDAYRAEHPEADAWLDAAITEGTPDDVAIIVYTSGTTGKPKGALLSHRGIIYATHAYAEMVGLEGLDLETVSYLPLCHVAERCYGPVMHLVMSGKINFAESIDTVAANVREIAPSYMLGVPRIWEKLQSGFVFRVNDSGKIRKKAYDWAMAKGRVLSDRRIATKGDVSFGDKVMSKLLYWGMFRNMQRFMGLQNSRVRMCGGASISPETLRFFDIIGLPVGQGYGQTESAGLAFVQTDTSYFRTGSSGRAFPNTEWKLGEDNEIFLRSPGVFSGYLYNDAATKDTVSEDGWLATGDIVEVLEGDEIAIVDRKKSIIITSGGKNIAPSEIENALKDSPYVKEAIVVGEGRKFLGAIIQIEYDDVGRWARDNDIAYTTFTSLAKLPETRELIQGIVDEVNGRFARVENIRRFALLEKELDQDDGELTATQKVRRAIIETKFEAEIAYIYGGTKA